MRSLFVTVLIPLLLGTSWQAACNAQRRGNIKGVADDTARVSSQDLPPELSQWRTLTPRPGKGVRTRALFQGFDPQLGLVKFLVESNASGQRKRARSGSHAPIVPIQIPLSDLVEDDQRLIKSVVLTPNQPDPRPQPGNSQDDGESDAPNQESSTLTSTNYWQAILAWKNIVAELHELAYQSQLNQLAASVYDQDPAAGLQRLQYIIREARERFAPIEHVVEVNQLALEKSGWDPDSVTREIRNQAFNQLVLKMSALAGQKRDFPRSKALSAARLYRKSGATKHDYRIAEDRWLTMVAQRAEGLRQTRWIHDLEKLSADQSRTTDKESRLRTRNKFRDERDAHIREMRSLQEEWSDLSGQYAGLPEADVERNRNPLTVGLEERCLQKRDPGQMTIEFSAPAWLSSGFPNSFRSANNGGQTVSFGYPIVAIVAAPAQGATGGRRIVLGDIALLPTREHYEPPAYAKPVDDLPGAKYAYFENGIRVWYGPINVTLEPQDEIDGFAYGDEMGQLHLLRQTLDLKELTAALRLDNAATSPADNTATPESTEAPNTARDTLRQERTWTTRDGRTAQARLSSFDPNRGVVLLDIPGRKQPYRMQVRDLSQQDQTLLSVAFQSEE